MAKRDHDLYERELDRFRETLRVDQDAALSRYGLTLINSLNPAERTQFMRQMGFDIADAVDFYNLGCQAATDENWSEAIDNFRRAVERDPDLTEAIHNLAVSYERTGHIPQAKSTWDVYVGSIRDEDEKSRIKRHLAEL